MFLRYLRIPVFGGICKRQKETFYMTNTFGSLNDSVNRNLGLFWLKLKEKSCNFDLCLMVEKRVEEGQDYLLTSVKRHYGSNLNLN